MVSFILQKTLLTTDVLQGMGEFFNLYDSKSSQLDEAIQETQQQAAKLRQEIEALRQKLNTNRYGNSHKKKR